MKTTQWHGCYNDGWQGVITPESFSHPAKFSRGLIERIYRHCLERGYLLKGDLVGDCFGGIGTGGVMAAYASLRWVGVELEPRFYAFAKANFALHADKWKVMGLPVPEIIQGDSRQFDKLVGKACGIVSSPPYAENENQAKRSEKFYKRWSELHGRGIPFACHGSTEGSPGQIGSLPTGDLAAIVSSPPYAGISPEKSGSGVNIEKQWQTYRSQGGGMSLEKFTAQQARHSEGYGQTSGQIGKLPAGEVAGVIASPPFCGAHEGVMLDSVSMSPPHTRPDHGRNPNAASAKKDAYGVSPGQIGRLKGGELAAVCTSPPFEKSDARKPGPCLAQSCAKHHVGTSHHKQDWTPSTKNLGSQSGETYWQAVRDVYAACYRVIKPGGVLVLVTKDYVKQRKRVLLSDDTVTLCESLGFVLIERIQAMLVSETRHPDLFTGEDVKRKERKSFFRRLAEKNGSPRIDHEDVLIFRRP